MHCTSQLPFLPISLHTLAEAPFFASSSPGIVRAGFYMLEAAWRSSRPGSIASSFSELANITRLTIDEVELQYSVLTAGWDLLEDGRLHHGQLEKICSSVSERFADQLDVLADSAAVAIQCGAVAFDLMPPTEVIKKKRGKHLLPKDFTLNKSTREFAHSEGFDTPDFQAWLMRTFTDFALAKNVMYVDWQAACRQFIGSEITRKQFKSRFHHYPGERVALQLASPQTASERLRAAASIGSTFQQRTMQSNSDKMHGESRFSMHVASASASASAPVAAAVQSVSKMQFGARNADVADTEFFMQDSPAQEMRA